MTWSKTYSTGVIVVTTRTVCPNAPMLAPSKSAATVELDALLPVTDAGEVTWSRPLPGGSGISGCGAGCASDGSEAGRPVNESGAGVGADGGWLVNFAFDEQPCGNADAAFESI